MKKFIFLILCATLVFAEEIAMQAQIIDSFRKNMESDLLKLENPFEVKKTKIIAEKNTTSETNVTVAPPPPEPTMILEAVINGDVKISGKWYSKGENVYNYKLSSVTFDEIELHRIADNKLKILKLIDIPKVEVIKE